MIILATMMSFSRLRTAVLRAGVHLSLVRNVSTMLLFLVRVSITAVRSPLCPAARLFGHYCRYYALCVRRGVQTGRGQITAMTADPASAVEQYQASRSYHKQGRGEVASIHYTREASHSYKLRRAVNSKI